MSWWQLLDVRKQAQQEFDYFAEFSSHIACPLCGEPLTYAPPLESASGVEKYCKYDGWQYPRDWVRPQRL